MNSANVPSPENGSPKSGNTILNFLKTVGNFLLMVVVTPVVIINEFRRDLANDVYGHGFAGALRAVIGGFLGFAASGYAGYELGWVLNWHTAAWVSLGVVAWFVTYCFAWPLFYLVPIKWPALKIAELACDEFRELAKNYAEKLFGGFVRGLSHLLPGSAGAWAKVLDPQKKESWVSKATIGLAYPISLVSSIYAGYSVYGLVAGYFSSPLLSLSLGVAAGLLSGLSLLGMLWEFIDKGKLPFVAVALAVGLDRVFSPEISGLSALLSLGGYLSIIGHALSIAFFVAYLFPLVNLLLSGGIIKWLVDQLKPLNEKAYDDRDKDYSEFFRNLATLVVTGIVIHQAFVWGTAITLPLWAFIPGLVAVSLFAYLWFYDVVDHGGGTFITGAASSLYAGWSAGSFWVSAGYAGGMWMAIPVGVVSTLLMGVLLFPGAYLILKPILVTLRISMLGKPLTRLHKAVEDGFHKVTTELMHAYDNSYRDRTGYQTWFLHACNIGIAGVVAWQLPAVLAHAPAFVVHLLSGASALIAAQVVGAVLSYILIGKFLQKSNIGTEFIGAISSLALAVWLNSHVVAVGAGIWTTAIVGIVGWIGGFVLGFPIAYIIVRYPAKFILASWSTTILVQLHDFAWSCFVVVWDKFVAVYRAVDKAILLPIRNALSAAGHKVDEAYNWLRDKIMHRGK